MGLTQTTAPAALPVSVGEAKQHSRVSYTQEDNVVERMIEAATTYCQDCTGRAFMRATYTQTQNNFTSPITIQRPPLSSVTSVTYIDTAGSVQTLAASSYTVVIDVEPGYIIEAFQNSWPATRDVHNAVSVLYLAGYDNVESIPSGYKQAILLLVDHWINERSPVVVGTVSNEVQLTIESLLSMNRLISV